MGSPVPFGRCLGRCSVAAPRLGTRVAGDWYGDLPRLAARPGVGWPVDSGGAPDPPGARAPWVERRLPGSRSLVAGPRADPGLGRRHHVGHANPGHGHCGDGPGRHVGRPGRGDRSVARRVGLRDAGGCRDGDGGSASGNPGCSTASPRSPGNIGTSSRRSRGRRSSGPDRRSTTRGSCRPADPRSGTPFACGRRAVRRRSPR